MKLSIIEALKPNKEYIDTLPFRDSMLIKFSICGNLVFSFGFLGMSASLFFQNLPMNAIFSICMAVFFLVSLVCIKKQKVYIGGYITTFGILASTVMVLFMTPPANSALLFYRDAFFVAAMAVCNQIVSFKTRQIYYYSTGSLIMWIVRCVILYPQMYVYEQEGTISAIIICSFAILIVNAVLLFLNSFNKKLVNVNEKAQAEAVENLSTITKVLEDSKHSFEIGKRLHETTLRASVSAAQLDNIYKSISSEVSGLSDETSSISKSSTQVRKQSDSMKLSVQGQNASITQTSAAMSEISSNLNSMSEIAAKRRESMDQIVNTLNSQMKLITDLLSAVSALQKSSDGIASFVKTVDEIATQTGLLAMNASIEAAHAGSAGKGFAVIAQEIRKLSEGSSKNAALISEELGKNADVVKSTSDAVNGFAVFTKQSTEEMRSSVQGMEEILAGISEMNEGTQEVMKSLQEIVDESHVTGDIVEDVSKEINSQDRVLEHISKFADDLSDKMTGMNTQLANIQKAISEIENEAAENVEFSEKLSESLKI